MDFKAESGISGFSRTCLREALADRRFSKERFEGSGGYHSGRWPGIDPNPLFLKGAVSKPDDSCSLARNER
tara:strand:- start:1404 stop:1616 length:213 start_codon:yes stop_codon:yes gene_type:complete